MHLSEHPSSYLAVTRAPEDVEPGQPSESEDLLLLGKQALAELLESEVFAASNGARYHLYRLELGSHYQLGIVCGVATSDYLDGTVRIHEQIDSSRAHHLARHFEVVRAQSSPIAMAFANNDSIATLLDGVTNAEPTLDFIAPDGLHQQLWPVTDSEVERGITDAIAAQQLYLIDGHHRAAAAAEYLQTLEDSEQGDPEQLEEARWMLSAIFPTNQVRSYAFHRIVSQCSLEDIIERVGDTLATRLAEPAEVENRSPSEIAIGVTTGNSSGADSAAGLAMRWLLVDLPEIDQPANPIVNLDPVRTTWQLLSPILGIDDTGGHERVRYVPAPSTIDEISRLNLAPTDAVFVMRPVPLDSLVAAADAGHTLPPKSTYFDPKVRSGVFLRQL